MASEVKGEDSFASYRSTGYFDGHISGRRFCYLFDLNLLLRCGVVKREDEFRKIGKTFINYLKTMKQGEHEFDNSISNIIK